MENLILFLQGMQTAFAPMNLLFVLVGVTIGMLIGVLPGIGPVAGAALLIPVTYGLDPTAAIILLAGIYYGSMYGGTITSVLLNIPGDSASVITTMDGHPLAKQGRAGVALGVAALGSFVGSTLALLALVFIAPALAGVALDFGPPEYFAAMLTGMLLIGALIGKSLVKGLISTFLGMALAMVGMEPTMGVARFNFGFSELLGGINFVLIAVGIFGLSQILLNLDTKAIVTVNERITGMRPRRAELRGTTTATLRGSIIGVVLGVIPAISAAVASLVSYATEKRLAKDPTRFGRGAVEGVAGPESANNAAAGASMIPLLTLGIPGSPTTAILLGAFMIHGLTPGPTLFTDEPEFVWAVIASLLAGNVILLIFNIKLINLWAKLIQLPYPLLYPAILAIAVIGAYSINYSMSDVVITLVFAAVGYVMRQLDFPVAPIALSFVLGGNIEWTLVQTLAMSNDGLLIFLGRPIALGILIACVAIAVIAMAVRLYMRFVRGKGSDANVSTPVG
ncbi:tripartite tricarboxylate transporter permease [Saccharomonospora sp. NPDC046836]|uniref:tripartite tricarboxylate transporter permease n=1 Tax=Saccharomonospora sp. NPDC046836 TaxID=3156921 RepID=UPI003407D86A